MLLESPAFILLQEISNLDPIHLQDNPGYYFCAFCNESVWDFEYSPKSGTIFPHSPECLWIRIRKYVSKDSAK